MAGEAVAEPPVPDVFAPPLPPPEFMLLIKALSTAVTVAESASSCWRTCCSETLA